MAEDEGETVAWKKSIAKKLLAIDIISGAIPDDMHWTDVYWQRPEFVVTKRRLFCSRLTTLRKSILHDKTTATIEEIALAHDRALFPAPTHNYRNEPRWEGSEAQRLLKEDVSANRHAATPPKQLYNSRPEYQDYPLKVFREHIYQEVRFVKFCTWRTDTGKKKATDYV
jgi:hypothetical protein